MSYFCNSRLFSSYYNYYIIFLVLVVFPVVLIASCFSTQFLANMVRVIKVNLNCFTCRKIKIGALLQWFWIVCFCGYSCLRQYLVHLLFYVKHQHSMTTHDQSIPSSRLLLNKFSIWVSRNRIKKVHQHSKLSSNNQRLTRKQTLFKSNEISWIIR